MNLSVLDVDEFGQEMAKLEENMVMAVEIWEGKRGGIQGCRIEEMVAVKEGGYDLISQFPIKELIECWI